MRGHIGTWVGSTQGEQGSQHHCAPFAGSARSQDGWGAQEGPQSRRRTLPAASGGGGRGAESPQMQGGNDTPWRGAVLAGAPRYPRPAEPWPPALPSGRYGCCACGSRDDGKLVPSAWAEPAPAPSRPRSSEMRSPRDPPALREPPGPAPADTDSPGPAPRRPACKYRCETAAPAPSPTTAPEPGPPGIGMGLLLLLPAGHRTLQAPAHPKSGTRRPAPACAMAACPLVVAGSTVAAGDQLPVPARPLPPAAAATLLFCPEPAQTTGAIVVGGSRKATVLPAEPASPGTHMQPHGARHDALPTGHRGWDRCQP